MSDSDHHDAIQAYLDLLIIVTASPDAENALPGINKVLFQIGDHVRALDRRKGCLRVAAGA